MAPTAMKTMLLLSPTFSSPVSVCIDYLLQIRTNIALGASKSQIAGTGSSPSTGGSNLREEHAWCTSPSGVPSTAGRTRLVPLGGVELVRARGGFLSVGAATRGLDPLLFGGQLLALRSCRPLFGSASCC